MSASHDLHPQSARILSLLAQRPGTGSESAEPFDALSASERGAEALASELKAYFETAGSWLTELKSLRTKYKTASEKLAEADRKIPELSRALERGLQNAKSLEAQVNALQGQLSEALRGMDANASRAKLAEANQNQERKLREALQSQVNHLAHQIRSMQSVTQSLSQALLREKQLSERVQLLSKQESLHLAEIRKLEIDSEVTRSKNELLVKKQEAQLEELHALRLEVYRSREELNRYRKELPQLQMDSQRVRSSENELHELREANRTLRAELHELEKAAKKDRRDKQIALNCLSQAEQKIDELSRALERRVGEPRPPRQTVSQELERGVEIQIGTE